MIDPPRLFTSHWRSGLLPDLDAPIVGISRGTPRRAPGFRYRVMRLLAPSDEVWREQETDAFEAAYIAQLEAIGTETILADLERIGTGRPCVCLCWERPDEPFCHRWVLSRWLHARAGIEVPELRPNDVSRRLDSPQVSLFESYREERE